MDIIFYIAATLAFISTILVITRLNAVHALLYLIASLLSVAVVFFLLGASFVAALEVIIYAGAIMVLFVFVIMMLNLGPHAVEQERQWVTPSMWIGPSMIVLILLGEILIILARYPGVNTGVSTVSPRHVAIALYGPYMLGVEMASMLLLTGLVGAYHLGRRRHLNALEEQA